MSTRTMQMVALLVSASVAAQADTISEKVLVLGLSAGGEHAEFAIPLDQNLFDPVTQTYQWQLGAPVDIVTEFGNVLGTLTEAGTFLDLDPQIGLNFTLIAGNTPVSVTLTSALISFGAISPAEGRATAGLTATDLNGDGVIIAGLLAGNTKSYMAQYNGAIPAGVTFATLVDNLAGGAFSTVTGSEEFPVGGGFAAIGPPVVSMQTQFSFNLSANDSVAGTSLFVVIPEPATLVGLCLAGLLVIRRR